ncbi:hypothetical protein U9M48_020474 [Paspalum notatum var. saurae]|uniref:Uncharacterized protein n=1 Tax=Paspalum notatum var. saurae TaxID=547442 RepID=A0AAQ3WSN1_PASNO
MLRLKQRLLSALHAAVPPPLPAASFHRPTSTAAGAPAGFHIEDYLVATCGLTPAQARKTSNSKKLTYLPVNPDAVRAFLAGIGLAEADIAAAIVRFPPLLHAKVEATLTPRVAMLRGIGLSPPQISRLITVAPEVLFSPAKVSRLAFYLSFLGSYERVHAALKGCVYLLRRTLEAVVTPNIVFLRQCGLTDDEIGKHFLLRSRMLLSEPQRVKEIAARAEELGVPRDSLMFKHALVVLYRNARRLNEKLGFLKKVLGCSEAELGNVLRRALCILNYSESKIGRTLEFLKAEVGLQLPYILDNPVLFTFSLERRLMPRHYVIRILKAKGLLSKEISFCTVAAFTEESFAKKFLLHFNKSVPGLIEAYAAACKGRPSTFPEF